MPTRQDIRRALLIDADLLFDDVTQPIQASPRFAVARATSAIDAVSRAQRAQLAGRPFDLVVLAGPTAASVTTLERLWRLDGALHAIVLCDDDAPATLASGHPCTEQLVAMRRPFAAREVFQLAVAASAQSAAQRRDVKRAAGAAAPGDPVTYLRRALPVTEPVREPLARAAAGLSALRDALAGLIAHASPTSPTAPVGRAVVPRPSLADSATRYLLEVDAPALVADALREVAAVTALLDALRVWSDPDGATRSPVALDVMLQGVALACRGAQPGQVALEIDVAGELPMVPCDPAALSSALAGIILAAAARRAAPPYPPNATGARSIQVRAYVEAQSACIDISGAFVVPVWDTTAVDGGSPPASPSRHHHHALASAEALKVARSVVEDAHGGALEVGTDGRGAPRISLQLPLLPGRNLARGLPRRVARGGPPSASDTRVRSVAAAGRRQRSEVIRARRSRPRARVLTRPRRRPT